MHARRWRQFTYGFTGRRPCCCCCTSARACLRVDEYPRPANLAPRRLAGAGAPCVRLTESQAGSAQDMGRRPPWIGYACFFSWGAIMLHVESEKRRAIIWAFRGRVTSCPPAAAGELASRWPFACGSSKPKTPLFCQVSTVPLFCLATSDSIASIFSRNTTWIFSSRWRRWLVC